MATEGKTYWNTHTDNSLLPGLCAQCFVLQDKPIHSLLQGKRIAIGAQSASEMKGFSQFLFKGSNIWQFFRNTHSSILKQVLPQIFVLHQWKYHAKLSFMRWHSQHRKYIWVVQYEHVAHFLHKLLQITIFHISFNWNRHFFPSSGCLCITLVVMEQELVLKTTAVQSPLLVMSSILPCPHCLPPVKLSVWGGVHPLRGVQLWGVWVGEGVGGGEGGWGEWARDISSTLPYTAPTHGASPQRDFAQ